MGLSCTKLMLSFALSSGSVLNSSDYSHWPLLQAMLTCSIDYLITWLLDYLIFLSVFIESMNNHIMIYKHGLLVLYCSMEKLVHSWVFLLGPLLPKCSEHITEILVVLISLLFVYVWHNTSFLLD